MKSVDEIVPLTDTSSQELPRVDRCRKRDAWLELEVPKLFKAKNGNFTYQDDEFVALESLFPKSKAVQKKLGSRVESLYAIRIAVSRVKIWSG